MGSGACCRPHFHCGRKVPLITLMLFCSHPFGFNHFHFSLGLLFYKWSPKNRWSIVLAYIILADSFVNVLSPILASCNLWVSCLIGHKIYTVNYMQFSIPRVFSIHVFQPQGCVEEAAVKLPSPPETSSSLVMGRSKAFGASRHNFQCF